MRLGSLSVAVVVLWLAIARPAAQGLNGSARWWHDQTISTQLGLTTDQITRIDGVFEDNLTGRRKRQAQLEDLRARFEKNLAQDDTVGATALIAPIVQLEAEQNKHRVIMLLRMRQVLTPEQRRLLQRLRPVRPLAADRRR